MEPWNGLSVLVHVASFFGPGWCLRQCLCQCLDVSWIVVLLDSLTMYFIHHPESNSTASSILVAFCARYVMYSSSSLPNPLGEEAWTAILADKTLLPSMLAYIPFTYQISCHVPKKQSSQHSLFSEGNQPKSNPKRFRRMGRDKRSKWKGGLYIPTTVLSTSSFVLWSFVDPPQLRWIPRWNPE